MFFRCLGWEGICVEPQSEYHANIRAKRSCTLVTECISSAASTVSFSVGKQGLGGVVPAETSASTATTQIKCLPFKDILSQHKNGSVTHVDFWSLDVEGYELTVLQSVDFSAISVSVMLIEDYWVLQRNLDLLMTQSFFSKYMQLAIDSLWVKRGFRGTTINGIYFPPKFKANIDTFTAYRMQKDIQKLIKC